VIAVTKKVPEVAVRGGFAMRASIGFGGGGRRWRVEEGESGRPGCACTPVFGRAEVPMARLFYGPTEVGPYRSLAR